MIRQFRAERFQSAGNRRENVAGKRRIGLNGRIAGALLVVEPARFEAAGKL